MRILLSTVALFALVAGRCAAEDYYGVMAAAKHGNGYKPAVIVAGWEKQTSFSVLSFVPNGDRQTGSNLSEDWKAVLITGPKLPAKTYAEFLAAVKAQPGKVSFASAGVGKGILSVGSDGRVAGTLDLSLRQSPRALIAMGEMGAIPQDQAQIAAAVALARQGLGDTAQATVTFEAGRTTLGPVAVGAAPQVYRAY